jgi:hypothetical protein
MFPLFLGLTAANLILLCTVFVMGLFVIDHTQEPTRLYETHLPLGVAAGLMAAFTHVAVYMYHMATARWLEAATDKAGVPVSRWVTPALARKRKVFFLMMGAIGMTMLTMFAGALADPTMNPLLTGEVHLLIGSLAIAANVGAALSEGRHIRRQGRLMDDALAVLNQPGPAAAAP